MTIAGALLSVAIFQKSLTVACMGLRAMMNALFLSYPYRIEVLDKSHIVTEMLEHGMLGMCA